MGKKKQQSALGKSVIRDRFGAKNRRQPDSFLHTSELNDGFEWGRLNLQSVTEQSTLEDFLTTAQMAGTDFQAEKMNVKLVNAEKHTGLLSKEEELKVRETQDQHRELLSIPRRPPWDEDTTADELDRRERDAFLEWRRGLAQLQDVEGLVMTPFERNLDFWRQLWRVIERSDVIVQIVDGRNPLLFYCDDIFTYVKEVGESKVTLLLVNKADFMTKEQRQFWANHFTEMGIDVIFWSAAEENERNKAREKAEQEALMQEETTEEQEEEEDEEEDIDYETDSTEGDEEEKADCSEISDSQEKQDRMDVKEKDTNALSEELENVQVEDNCEKCAKTAAAERFSAEGQWVNSADIAGGEELVEIFKRFHSGPKHQDGITTVGLVGYPNVGKSSTINAILQTKKVPVSATPGRTKHFQTLYVEPTVMLCDCPGLVMPTFVSTKAHMVVSGILPIDQMRDYVPPVSLVCQHIPRAYLELTYGLMLPAPRVDDGEEPDRRPTAHELLASYACMRGYMTHKGIPDYQRAARFILKDYMNGKLLYCHAPPAVADADFLPTPLLPKVLKVKAEESLTAPKHNPSAHRKYTSSVDKAFFTKEGPRIGSKGAQGGINYTRADGLSQQHVAGGAVTGSQQRLADKPWKKHNNRGKKEKLRRNNRALDVHDVQ